MLLRLEKNGLIKAEYRESPVGPKRKYFAITVAGMHEIGSFMENWRELENAVNAMFARSEDGDDQDEQKNESAQPDEQRAR